MAIVERTRAIVEADERYDGKIVPLEQAEIDRRVTIREGATVSGGIYGENVTLETGSLVQGSIMASNGVELTDCEVASAVGTPGKVTATGAHVRSTVTGSKVQLTDCVVRGNVVGSDIVLENCVVLGLVVGERSLDIADSLCYTLKSYGETRLADVNVVLPQAVVDGSVTLETPVGVLGIGGEDDEHTSLTRHDLVDYDGTQYLTLADRVLNLEAVRERIDELETELQAAVIDGVGSNEHSFEHLGIDDLPDAGVSPDERASVPEADEPRDGDDESVATDETEDEADDHADDSAAEADVDDESSGDDVAGQAGNGSDGAEPNGDEAGSDDDEAGSDSDESDAVEVDAEPVEGDFFDEATDGDDGEGESEPVEEDEEDFFDL